MRPMERRITGILAFSVLAASLCCCGGRSAPSRAAVGCERDKIEYNNRHYTASEALALFRPQGAKENDAVRKISNLVGSQFEAKGSLCDKYVQGELSELEYKARLDRVAERFAAAMRLEGALPAHQIQQVELPLYLETLSKLEPDAKAQSVDLGFHVIAEGREMKTGEVLFRGDEVRLIVEVNILAYLYVFLIDSGGSLSLLYPPGFRSGLNPVQGRVEIPSGETDVLVLDDTQGLERFIVLVETEKSKVIEPMFYNARAPGGNPRAVAEALWRCAKSRLPFTKTGLQNRYSSQFGQASLVFEIEHR